MPKAESVEPEERAPSTIDEYLAAVDAHYKGRVALSEVRYDHRRASKDGQPLRTYEVKPREGSELVLKAVMSRHVADWGTYGVKSRKITSVDEPFIARECNTEQADPGQIYRADVFWVEFEADTQVLTPQEDETEFWKSWRRDVGMQAGARGGFVSAGHLAGYDEGASTVWSLRVRESDLGEIAVTQLLDGQPIAQWPSTES